MSLTELVKKMFEARKIKRIAIIDDVFDVPVPERIDRNRYSQFSRTYNGNQDLKKSINWVSGKVCGILPRFDDLDEDIIEPFWISLWKQEVGGRKLKPRHESALRGLFEGHSDNVLEMLDSVGKIYTLFREDLKRSVTVHGAEFDPNDLAEAQIIVIDYFLELNLTKKEALERTSEVVVGLVEAARTAKRTVPSFLLVSARPTDVEIDEFPRLAKLMRSRFRFFSKDELHMKRTEHMVNLHDLVDASDRTEIIERLIEDWRNASQDAIETVCETMLDLDVSDLVYLDCFRLAHEGTSIGNYLRWFMTASLDAGVTPKLTNKLWRNADSIRLFELIDEGGQLEPGTLIKTFDGPSDAIAHAYGDILFDETRGTGEFAFPAQLPAHDLIEGDLFVRPKDRSGKGYDGADVRLVMTPSCDLISRAPNQPPSAQNVLLLPGVLKRVRKEQEKSRFTEIDFVRVREGRKLEIFQITWNFRRPMTIEWSRIRDSGMKGGFKRLGRVRALYFHKIRDTFANGLTRIGTEVAPLLPHPRDGEVFIAVVNGRAKRFEKVMCFSSEDKFVWEIGPIRIKGRKNETWVYQASQKFVQKLDEKLKRLKEGDNELAGPANHGVMHLENMQTYMDLLRPMPPGVRGANGAVEFKKAVPRSSDWKKSSRGNLLIVTFVD